MSSLPVQTLKLHEPPIEELRTVIEKGLKGVFTNVAVAAVDCPNLENAPFGLAGKGLCGQPRLIDVGGVKNLIPNPKKEKIYSLDEVTKAAQLPGAFVIGAGAGPFHKVGVNCEFMANARTNGADYTAKNDSFMAKVDIETDGCHLFQMRENNEFCLMLNALVCEGKPGKVLEVRASHRIGKANFPNAMREALKNKYGLDSVGMGGVFLIQRGKAKMHIMPDFSSEPLTDVSVNEWLRFYEMQAPLVCLSTFVSHDPDLDLRLEHTHCFSNHNEGGHYHDDVTPEEVEYLGYFVPAEILYRIDKP